MYGPTSIKKVVNIQDLNEHKKSTINNDLAYWLSRTSEERILTVEYLRRQYHGNSARLQRTARIVQRSRG